MANEINARRAARRSFSEDQHHDPTFQHLTIEIYWSNSNIKIYCIINQCITNNYYYCILQEPAAADEDAYDDEPDPDAGPSSGDHSGGHEEGNPNQAMPSASNEGPSSEVVHPTPAAALPEPTERPAAASSVEPSSASSPVVESQWRLEEGGTHQPGGVWYRVFA